jgi:nucleotidyltransferase substrate binding protein (TIGR01987 family)
MELKQKFDIELLNLKQAISTFNNALELKESSKYSELELDLLKNGKIQKFEYCPELAWKVCKIFLELKTSEIFISPKLVYKNLFLNRYFSDELYEKLFRTIEDRNKLSHIYKEEMYSEVYKKLETHLAAFKNLLIILYK